MNYNEFEAMVCELIGLDQNELNGNTSFINELGIDSLTLSNLIIKLEIKYSIKFDISNVWEIKNINDAYQRLEDAIKISKLGRVS